MESSCTVEKAILWGFEWEKNLIKDVHCILIIKAFFFFSIVNKMEEYQVVPDVIAKSPSSVVEVFKRFVDVFWTPFWNLCKKKQKITIKKDLIFVVTKFLNYSSK